MSYFLNLGLSREPFSTSPDPSFFYKSMAHNQALQRLEIAIRLRRGLSVILGDVGTGKTTLARCLVNAFSGDGKYLFHILLDPDFKSEYQFLHLVTKLLNAEPLFRSTLDYKEAIEKFLFQKGVEEDKTVVLLIDEGQKLSPNILEILRILLNFETNEYKLLQLVIFGQMELLPKVQRIRNFTDRINLKYIINPLNLQETRELIEFRLRKAGWSSSTLFFTDEAVKKIYEVTQGYPRRIALICHNALEQLVMTAERIVDSQMISELVRREEPVHAL
ncbi:MAG: AAA family ATPase [Candidatus Omnitrophica bacterium]|nr:AAA family ATPase [Candidatus Omnitrophota bacterium]